MAKQDNSRILRWKAENVIRIPLEVRKDSHIIDRLQRAVSVGKAKSRQDYIVTAIVEKLDRDGIPLEVTAEENN